MILCDIGNTSYHFLDDKKEYKKDTSTFNPSTMLENIYYICVNLDVKNRLKNLDNWIDLAPFVDIKDYYQGMGIDRILACEAVNDRLIIDAGSAITVDIVKNKIFQGGFIYPGTKIMQETYVNISSVLNYSFNYELDLDIIPKNSQDAISYGYLKTLYCEVMSHNMDVIITGGDAKKLAKIFPDATIDEMLLFKGMKKIIKKADLC